MRKAACLCNKDNTVIVINQGNALKGRFQSEELTYPITYCNMKTSQLHS